MTTFRAQRMEELFFAAQSMRPQERSAFLLRECGGDEGLVTEIEGLLAAATGSEEYFSSLSARIGAGALFPVPPAGLETADVLAGAAHAPPSDELAGSVIGGYRLVRELGAGGMASVWLADRADGLIQRPVALKLPHIASRRAGLADRMARERAILAALTHPNIARLYDAGVTAEGRPYLALEYVEGLPIVAYCDEHRLDLRARLSLFLQVAKAVAHAHAKLIIHRDLKPANILVTHEGEARLLDFGVAKLLDDTQETSEPLTELSGRALTPDYASPEQILGEPLTIATDVYSLGIVLYELCAGARAYKLNRESRRAMEDAVLSVEPPKPSEACQLRWGRQLRGDLDTLILKALDKRPDQRYATVNALAEDIARYLDNRPVLARPGSPWRRFVKFTARNRIAVAAAGVTTVAILGGAVLALWQARIALAEKERAEEVREFVVAMFRNANPYKSDGQQAGAADLLHDAMARIEAIDASRADLRVELMNLSGAALLGLQDTDDAERVIQKAVSEARRKLPADHPQALESRSQLITVHRFRGRTAAMEQELAGLLPMLRARSESMPEALVNALRDAAHLAIDLGRYDEAVTHAREATQMSRRRLGEEHEQTAESWQVLGMSLLYAQRHAEALETTEKAFALALRSSGANERHPQVINTRASYARALVSNGHLSEGVSQLERATRDAVAVFGDDSRMVGFFSQNLVHYQLELGRVDEAIASAERALRILAQHAQAESATYGATLATRGWALLAARRSAAALPDLQAAYRTSSKLLGEKHPVTATMGSVFAAGLAFEGRSDEARTALATARAAVKDADSRTTHWQGVTARLLGDYPEALRLQRVAYEKAEPLPRGVRLRADALIEIGLAHEDLNQHAQARTALETALRMLAEHHISPHPARAEALVGLGRARLALGDPKAASVAIEEADAFWRNFDPGHHKGGEAASWLGRCYLALGRTTDAAKARARAEKILFRRNAE